MVKLVFKRTKLTGSEEIEEFLKLYPTFFDEFHGQGLSAWIYYIIFVIRRAALILTILCLKSPVIQLAVSLAFSLFVIFI